ncbi:hypothetical protein [Ulvibacterium sp.]|uniref:hypothetical protein n=1 Tax=Ulvibacterium sp. TaxID=2665914 RepID=UPI002630BC1C|nr:hypothetical protein [Ulvibacterium sp.]
MRIKKYLRILFWTSFVTFALNKFYIRPWVLKNDLPYVFQISVLSLPNLIEAIMGTIVVTGLAFGAKRHLKRTIGNSSIYLISVALTAIYVIAQELGYHNMGGNNVYDPYDLTASVLGLLLMLGLFHGFGFSSEHQQDA